MTKGKGSSRGGWPILGSELVQSLTENFHLWEQRGRGWQVAEYPVELEPPFEPFYHFRVSQGAPIDDSRKSTFLSSLADAFTGRSKGREEVLRFETYELSELEPEPYDDDSRIRELRLILPAKQKVTLDLMEALLLNLSSCAHPLSFEIVGTHDVVLVQMACRGEDAATVRQQIKAFFPEISVEEQSGYLESAWGAEHSLVVDFGLSKEFMRPLRRVGGLEIDPLIGIVAALEDLEPGETAILQVLFQPVRHPWAESAMRAVTDSEGKPFFSDAPEMVPLTKEKVKHPLYAVVLRVGVSSPYEGNTWKVARSIGAGLRHLADSQSNELIPLDNDGYDYATHAAALLTRLSFRTGMILNSEELVSLVHLPSVSVRAGKLVRDVKKTKAAPPAAVGHKLVLGENVHQGRRTVVSLGPEERLRHMYIVGATGTGKSTLLLSLIAQDIEHGQGIAVLDPHGDLIDKILGHIPEKRLGDVILIDPSDADYPVGLNVLSSHSDVEMNVLSSDLVSVFRRLSTSWGDQMNSVFSNAIVAFLESDRGGTLADLRRFLVEPDFRRSFLGTVKDQEIIYYWLKEFPMLSGKPQGPILTRLDTFLRPKLIRNMVCQKEGLNFEKVLEGRKILLAKLSQGLIGEENAYLLGTLLVSKLQQAAMARQSREASDRHPYYLYVDEFQNFVTPSMASILSGARKYGLGLVLAHQELRQLWNRDTEVASSVLANAGTRICFRLGDFDAQKLAEGFSTFDAADLQNLKIGEALCRLERFEQDFNLTTMPVEEVDSETARERQARAIESSRKRYAHPKAEVEARLAGERAAVTVEATQALEPPAPQAKTKKAKAPEAEVREEGPTIVEPPRMEGKGGPGHKYLQSLVKRMAEEKGFRAIIEKTLPNGGSVDVSIEGDKKLIACEISETTSDQQEMKNIQKCLEAGYEKVILCSQEKKFLDKVREAATAALKKKELEKVLFLQPEELYFLLEEEAAALAGKEARVKGYKVKTKFSPVREGEKKAKREAVAKVILDAMRRMKGEKK